MILAENAEDEQQQHFEKLLVMGLNEWQQDRKVFSRFFECFTALKFRPQYLHTKIVILWNNLRWQRLSILHMWYSSQRCKSFAQAWWHLQQSKSKSENLTKQQEKYIHCNKFKSFTVNKHLHKDSASFHIQSSLSSNQSINIEYMHTEHGRSSSSIQEPGILMKEMNCNVTKTIQSIEQMSIKDKWKKRMTIKKRLKKTEAEDKENLQNIWC